MAEDLGLLFFLVRRFCVVNIESLQRIMEAVTSDLTSLKQA